jgi:dephospho-CoA kinase
MFAGKPIIGILGGVGSGKSHVARLFGELRCVVINSDDQVTLAYQRDDVKRTLASWWGDDVLDAHGEVNRRAIARRVFSDPKEREKLEALLHPIVAQMRQEMMEKYADDPNVYAYVWDTPLLVETGLHLLCDALVFVDAPFEERLRRVSRSRGWDEAELRRREKIQLPLDKKRELANDVLKNTAGADEVDDDGVRNQVREVLSRILARTAGKKP